MSQPMKTAVQQANAPHVALVAAPSAIIAAFQRQKLLDPKRLECVDVGQPMSIDVTDLVLLKSARDIRNLRDAHPSTDALVPYGRHLHNGLYKISVTASIKSFFAVSNLHDIDQSMVDAALEQHTRIQRAKQAQIVASNPPRTTSKRILSLAV
jgi:hypothetical protein